MQNVIEVCLRTIFAQIPRELLNLAFPAVHTETMDERICSEVLRARVLPDCNCIGGKLKHILLETDWIEPSTSPSPYMFGYTDTYCLYRIPAKARENRSIVSTSHIALTGTIYAAQMSQMYPSPSTFGMNTLGSLASQVLNSHTFEYASATPMPILRSGDLIMLTPMNYQTMLNRQWTLTCRLDYDEEFTNLNQQALPVLRKLAVAAVKAYIYNLLIIRIDQGELESGQQLGIIKELVSSYSDQNDVYSELLPEFNGAATILDEESRQRIIQYAL